MHVDHFRLRRRLPRRGSRLWFFCLQHVGTGSFFSSLRNALLGAKGVEANWSQPGSWSDRPGKRWNPRGQGYLGKGHCPGGGQGGKGGAIHNTTPLVALAVVLEKGALPLGGKGSGWGRPTTRAFLNEKKNPVPTF